MKLPADYRIVPVDHLADEGEERDYIRDDEERQLFVLASSRFSLGRIIEEAFRDDPDEGERL